MGAGNKMQAGSMAIFLETVKVFPGDEIVGEVYLSVPKVCMFFGVEVRVIGRELVNFRKMVVNTSSTPISTTNPRTQPESQMKTFIADHVFFSYDQLLVPQEMGYQPVR